MTQTQSAFFDQTKRMKLELLKMKVDAATKNMTTSLLLLLYLMVLVEKQIMGKDG